MNTEIIDQRARVGGFYVILLCSTVRFPIMPRHPLAAITPLANKLDSPSEANSAIPSIKRKRVAFEASGDPFEATTADS